MITKIQTTDLRTTNLTFEDIANGSMFTEKDYGKPYIKMSLFILVDIVHRDNEEIAPQDEGEFNAVDLYGNPYWFEQDHEVENVNEIYVNLK